PSRWPPYHSNRRDSRAGSLWRLSPSAVPPRPEEMTGGSSRPPSFGCNGRLQQAFTWPHAGELDRLVVDRLPALLVLTDDRVGGRVEIAGLGEIGAEMCAARVLAALRSKRDDAAGLGERTQVEPVVPGEIEGRAGIGHAGAQKLGLKVGQLAERAVNARRVANDTDIVP